ncbi:hypothetical protein, partial [Rhodovulum sp. 12E13]|uniref:hypothetical protein n=1 Tax=Rhodovulum sp. 12E13 TaxID=2203891 RepID=UPI0018F37915
AHAHRQQASRRSGGSAQPSTGPHDRPTTAKSAAQTHSVNTAGLENDKAIALSARGQVIELVHHVPRHGFFRPSPENPEASHLLAHAESERERLPSALKYIHIFEAGFGMREEGKLINKIVQYFSGTGIEVQKSEVRQWFNLRGEEAHAAKGRIRLDRKQYDRFFRRLRQAAMELSYNKRNWGTKDTMRTLRQNFSCWYDKNGGIRAAAGKPIEYVWRRDLLANRLLDLRIDKQAQQAFSREVGVLIKDTILPGCEKYCEIYPFSDEGSIRVVRNADLLDPAEEDLVWEFQKR